MGDVVAVFRTVCNSYTEKISIQAVEALCYHGDKYDMTKHPRSASTRYISPQESHNTYRLWMIWIEWTFGHSAYFKTGY